MLPGMIERSDSDGVVTLRLAYGKVNALDIELAEALTLALAELSDSDARAVILTGTGSSFSAGVDLYRLVGEGVPYVERFFPALSRLFLDTFAFPKPLIVAVNGHAIAGGCIFTLCGDHRVMQTGKARIGMPELLVGVPFPASIVEIIRFAVPPQHLQMLVYSGRTFTADDALRYGLIDEIAEDAGARSTELGRHFATLPAEPLALVKRQLRDKAISRAKHYANELDRDALALWSAPETHERIKAYLASTVKK
jgi:enoyl-CoA hydratase